MNHAEQAYEAARSEILRVRAAGEYELDLSFLRYRSLTTLPDQIGTLERVTKISLNNTQITDLTPLASLTSLTDLRLMGTPVHDITPLAGLSGLIYLDLDNTKVKDIAPLAGLSWLTELDLRNTKVADLAPLGELSALEYLSIKNTEVADLRPLIPLIKLGAGEEEGLWYADTPVSRATPELARLSQVEDGNYAKCYRDTRDYLLTLPPWPEPLPWDVPEGALDAAPPAVPSIDGQPILILTDDQRVDLATIPPGNDDLADPIKARLYAKLPAAAERLWRAGNQFPQVRAAAEALRDLTGVPFADADLLDIHLQLAALTDVRTLDPDQPAKERLDADCQAALNEVLRLGPPVTLGHPDIDLMEARNTAFAQTRKLETEAEGERQVASAIEAAPDLATDRTRAMAGTVATSVDQGRLATFRTQFTRNAVTALATVAGALGDAALGYIPGTAVALAMDFLYLNRSAIVAMSAGWGETGYAWVEYLMARIKQAIDEAGADP